MNSEERRKRKKELEYLKPTGCIKHENRIKSLIKSNFLLKRRLISSRKRNAVLRNSLAKTKSEKLDLSLLDKRMNPLAAEIFRNELKNSDRPPRNREYSAVIKDFSLKQSFYSGSGYDQLRSSEPGKPGLSLPSRRSMRRYVFPVDCGPGFLLNVIKTLGEEIRNKKHGKECTLVLDEASLHKAQGWDPRLKQYIGRCTNLNRRKDKEYSTDDERIVPADNDDNEEDEDDDLATQVLVFMLVGLDGTWRQPIGYWFTKHHSGEIVATLVKQSLQHTHEHGVDIRALVFDGLPANITMVNSLGAKISSNFEEMINWFEHPWSKKKVYIIFDACHMLKLMRNLLGDYKEIWLPGFDIPAKWSHFEELNRIQEEMELRAGNRITKNHIEYAKHKMKVAFAAQIYSQSSATFLDDSRLDGSNSQLLDSETTSFLCRKMDQLFDFCNSRSPKATGQRAPLTPSNFHTKKKQMVDILELMKGMSVKQTYKKKVLIEETGEIRGRGKERRRGRGQKDRAAATRKWKTIDEVREVLVKDGKRKTCVVGFHTTVHSIFDLAQDLFNDDDYKCKRICTYFLLQDYLEHFFSLVRQHGGWNDNPTPVQFKYIMRKLIVMKFGGLTPSLNGNCSIVPEIDKDGPDDNEDLREVVEYSEKLDEQICVDNLRNRILAYIGGYVVAKLLPTLKCQSCCSALENSSEDPIDPAVARLIRLKDKGGLKYPSKSTYKIIMMSEKVFLSEIANQKKIPNTPNILTYLSVKVLRLLNLDDLFPTLKVHVLEHNPAVDEIEHVKLTKMIILRFLKVRCLSYCNVVNRKRVGTSSRNRNLKTTHFRNE